MRRARAHTCDQDRIAQQPVVAAKRSPPSSTTAGIVALPVVHSRMIRPQQCGSHQPGSHQGAACWSQHSQSNSGRHRGRNSHRTHPPSSMMPDPGSGGAQANAVPGSRSISPRIRRASRDQDVADACRHTTLSPSTEPRAREQYSCLRRRQRVRLKRSGLQSRDVLKTLPCQPNERCPPPRHR